jgi:hypothetical protein
VGGYPKSSGRKLVNGLGELWDRSVEIDPEMDSQRPAARVGSYSDEQLLQYLREFLEEHGKLTERSIDSCWDMPSPEVYHSRFGSLLEAYKRIGYTPPGSFFYLERDRKLLPIRRGFVRTVIGELTTLGVSVRQDGRTKLIFINEKFTVRVAVARCRSVAQ